MAALQIEVAEKSDNLCYREADQSMKEALTTGDIDDFRRWCRANPDLLVSALDWIYSHHHVHREIVELELRDVRHRRVIERLAAIERPHWTMTPGFWVSVGGFLLAGLAAWFAWLSIPRPIPQDAVSPPSASSPPPPAATPSAPQK